MARPPSGVETASISREIKLKPTENERLKNYAESSGVPVATFVKRATFEKLDELERTPTRAFDPVPVHGVISAGPAIDVIPFDDVFVTPPFEMVANSYVLLVAGDSMEAVEGLSVPNGSYAVFQVGHAPHFNSPVHVEWEDSPGVRVCTMKLYRSHGEEVEFAPLNENHKPIRRKKNSFEIRGVYVEYWKQP